MNATKTMKVFWSWQSDTLAKNSHFFVRDALALALEQVASDLDLTEAERPEVDHDTKGEAGLVSIVDTIFEKINQAALFVGDLTYVGTTKNGKLLPNPNVMIELGHAITSLGPERIILVCNRAHGGKPEDLPFDLRHRRAPISFNLPDTATAEDRRQAQRELIRVLVPALAGCLARVRDQAAIAVEYPAAIARTGDRSIWLKDGELIQHLDYFHNGSQTEYEVVEMPRFYLRVIPARYEGSIRPREVQDLPSEFRLAPLTPWASGDGGVNSRGVVKVGVLKSGKAIAATQWFKKTSEVWAFNGAATFQSNGNARLIAPPSIARSWREHLDRTIAFLEHIGVSGSLQIEAGVTDLGDTAWGDEIGRRHTALESEIYLKRADAKWSPETRAKFLTDAFNLLNDAYNQPAISLQQFFSLK